MSSANAYKNKRQLEEALARKRDLEFRKAEECKARVKYYSNFDRANMHFQTWTAPEYYKQCAESLQKSKIEKEKERKLSERRERLQKMLETERHALNEELRILEQGHTNRRRDKKVSDDVVCEIYKQLKIDSEERRRKELEDSLYQQWRKNEGCKLLNAPEFNEHHALAKMSWMDKQVMKQLDKEKKIKNQIITNQTEVEQIKSDLNILWGQQKDMKSDYDKLKQQIEQNLVEYQEIEKKYNLTKGCEKNMKQSLNDIENIHTDYFRIHEKEIQDRDQIKNNVKFHKLQLKQYNEQVINYLEYKIKLIKQLKHIESHNHKIKNLLSSTLTVLLKQYKVESQRKQHICMMYDSEARRVWDGFVEKWQNEEKNQYEVIAEILNIMKTDADEKYKANITAQNECISEKEKLLKKLEDINCKKSYLEKDIESNKNQIDMLTSNKLDKETKCNLLTDYLNGSDKIDVSKCDEKRLLSPVSSCTVSSQVSSHYSNKYRDSVRDIIYTTFTPQSAFNCDATTSWKRDKSNSQCHKVQSK